jgi:hypothetical protein
VTHRTGRMRANHGDLIAVSCLIVAALIAVTLEAPTVVRLVLAPPLVLFIPGYALIAALFPSSSLPGVERVVVATGASIGLTMLVGLILALTPVGLGALQWAAGLAFLSLLFVVIAWIRRWRLHRPGPELTMPTLRRIDAAVLILAAIGVVGIIVGTRVIATQQEETPPVLLWMLPDAAGTLDAHVGVRAGSPEGDYILRVTSTGVVLHEFRLSLAAGETWESMVALTEEDRAGPVVARLYDGTGNQELRFVVLQPPSDGA